MGEIVSILWLRKDAEEIDILQNFGGWKSSLFPLDGIPGVSPSSSGMNQVVHTSGEVGG